MTETKYVAYLRVSTQKQGYSGLGLEAQREIIHNYLRDTTPISEYVEVESGRKSDRPKLKEALSQCRKESATLIVAKLDRLARSVSFLSNLLESDVEIIFCDFPRLTKWCCISYLRFPNMKQNLLQQEPKHHYRQRKQEDSNLAIQSIYWISMSKQSRTASRPARLKRIAILITRGLLLCSVLS